MNVELLVESRGGNPNIYQIDGKDLVNIGNNSFPDDIGFEADKVQKIAILDYDWENIGQLHLFPYNEKNSKFDKEFLDKEGENIENLFSKKSQMGEPTIIATDELEEEELSVPVEKVKHGDSVMLSGYNFEVIILENGKVAYYNRENKVVFTDAISENKEKLEKLDIEEVYLSHRKPLKGREVQEFFKAT